MINRKEKCRRELVTRRLQLSLPLILNIGGWSDSQFADKLGITKQSISNWTNHKTKLNYLQYIAIRAVLDSEIAAHPEKKALAETVHLLLDTDSTVTDEDFSKRLEQAEIAAARAGRGLNDNDLMETFRKFIPILCGIAYPVAGIAAAGAYWLMSSKANTGETNPSAKEDEEAGTDGTVQIKEDDAGEGIQSEEKQEEV